MTFSEIRRANTTSVNDTVRSVVWSGNPGCGWPLPPWTLSATWWTISRLSSSKDRIKLDRDCGCIFRALFKPSDELARLIDEEQARVLPGGAAENYTALHYRVFTGLRGEGGEAPPSEHMPPNITEHTAFMRTVQCARERTGNITVFAAVSDVNARRAINRGLVPGVVGPSHEWAIHPAISFAANVSERPERDEHLQTFVEMGVLSRAAFGVWSRSGFSNVARWMQGKGPDSNFIVAGHSGGEAGGCLAFREVGGIGGV